MSNTAPLAIDDFVFRTEFLVNQGTSRWQSGPVVSEVGEDRFVVVYQAYATQFDPVSGGLVARFFNMDGTPIGDEFAIAEHEKGRQVDPTVTTMSDGSFLVGWESEDGVDDPTGFAFKARYFEADGTPASDEFLVNELTTHGADRYSSEYAELPDGRVLAVYVQQSLAGEITRPEIFGRILDKTGQPAGEAFKLDNGAYNGSRFFLDVVHPDRIVVSYFQHNRNTETASGLRTQVYDLSGTPVGDSSFEPVPEDQIGSSAGSYWRLGASTVLQDGSRFQTWVEEPFPGNLDLKGRFVAPDGSLIGDAFTIPEDSGGNQFSPDFVELSTGQIAIVWSVFTSGNFYYSDIKARVFNLDGTPASDEFLVHEAVIGQQDRPSIAALPDGKFVVTWQSNDRLDDRDVSGVKARIFNADGTPASGTDAPTQNYLTNEKRPIRIAPEKLLENDNDPDGDSLSIVDVSAESALGGSVRLLKDGTILYDPSASMTIKALEDGEILQDSFTYRVSDGAASDEATVLLEVAGVSEATGFLDYADDDAYEISAEDLLSAGTSRIRLSDEANLLSNDRASSIYLVNGAADFGVWFDGNNGGQFRVFDRGVVDFRNHGEVIGPGDTTGFAYITERSLHDEAVVTLTITGLPSAAADEFSVSATDLDAAGSTWFRLGAKKNNTDLLENDLGVDEIVFIDDAALQPGVWFDGDAGGQFRVFAGGVVDFRNQGDPVSPGDETGFSYSGYDAAGELATGHVTVAFDAFDLI